MSIGESYINLAKRLKKLPTISPATVSVTSTVTADSVTYIVTFDTVYGKCCPLDDYLLIYLGRFSLTIVLLFCYKFSVKEFWSRLGQNCHILAKIVDHLSAIKKIVSDASFGVIRKAIAHSI